MTVNFRTSSGVDLDDFLITKSRHVYMSFVSSTTFTIPSTNALVTITGGGGGNACSGGAGGGTLIALLQNLTIGAIMDVVVGGGGAGISSTAESNGGGYSSVGYPSTGTIVRLYAYGGEGGKTDGYMYGAGGGGYGYTVQTGYSLSTYVPSFIPCRGGSPHMRQNVYVTTGGGGSFWGGGTSDVYNSSQTGQDGECRGEGGGASYNVGNYAGSGAPGIVLFEFY